MRDAVEIHVYESLCVRHLSFVRFGLRATRMRCGRFSSSSCRACGIVLRRGEIAQPVRHAQHKKDRGVYPDRDAGIALFNFDEGRAADRRALRRDCRWDAPPPPGITDVVAELAQGMPYREWHEDG